MTAMTMEMATDENDQCVQWKMAKKNNKKKQFEKQFSRLEFVKWKSSDFFHPILRHSHLAQRRLLLHGLTRASSIIPRTLLYMSYHRCCHQPQHRHFLADTSILSFASSKSHTTRQKFVFKCIFSRTTKNRFASIHIGVATVLFRSFLSPPHFFFFSSCSLWLFVQLHATATNLSRSWNSINFESALKLI